MSRELFENEVKSRTVRLVRACTVGPVTSCRLVIGDQFLVDFDTHTKDAEKLATLIGQGILTACHPKSALSPMIWKELTEPNFSQATTKGPAA